MKVTVYLMMRAGRTCWEAQWKDPITGRKKTRSTGTAVRREAERFAGKLESELNEGTYRNAWNAPWGDVADRYLAEVLSSRARKTQYKFRSVRQWLDKFIAPQYASLIDADMISRFQAMLREKGQAEATIKGHLSSLRACLNWADKIDLIASVPHFAMPKRINKSKGRALTEAEYKSYLVAMAEEVKKEADQESFTELIQGLWLSGLRLEEAIRLTWEPTFDGISVDLSGDMPRLRIEANEDKSTKARLLPITPDFGDFLLRIPSGRRTGRVFRPRIDGMRTEFMRADTCGDILRRIGKRAKIIVAEYRPKPGQTEPQRKYASAQDFRRTFGTRWAPLVTPQQLQQLMRHESIQTTMAYYVTTALADIERATIAGMQQLPNSSPNVLPFRKTG